MNLKVQKRIAAGLLKCSPKKIRFEPSEQEEIKESITKKDIWGLIKSKIIWKAKTQEISRSRARKIQIQKRKGKRKGAGSRKGKQNASLSGKKRWMNKIRAQRELLSELREGNKIAKETYKMLYRKAKGGFFRSRRHIMIYANENNLINNENKS